LRNRRHDATVAVLLPRDVEPAKLGRDVVCANAELAPLFSLRPLRGPALPGRCAFRSLMCEPTESARLGIRGRGEPRPRMSVAAATALMQNLTPVGVLLWLASSQKH
jgi:hypothetical protein